MKTLIIDMLPMAAIGLDDHGNIGAWNVYAQQLLGWTAAEATGQGYDTLLFGEIARQAQSTLVQELFYSLPEVMPTEAPLDWVLFPLLHKNGEQIILELQVRKYQMEGMDFCCWLFLREKGEIIAEKTEWLGLQDELQRMHARIQARHRRLDAVLDTAPVILIEVGNDGCFRFAAGAGLIALGLSHEGLLGKSVERMYEAVPSVLTLHRRALLGDTFSAENCQNGNYYLTHFAPIRNTQGELAGYTAVINDITPLKVAEAELHAAQAQLASSLSTREQFLAHVSHELRNPLLGLLGIAEQLRSTTSPDNLKWVEALTAQSQFMQRLIEDLLTITKLKSGAFTIRPKVFNLQALFDRVHRWAAIQAQQKSLQLLVRHNLPEKIYCWGDATRLEQILLNLLQNALRYTQAGNIGLCLNATADKSNGKWDLSWTISDSGQGFLRTPNEMFAPEGSYSLGLNIVEELAQHMQATLSVQSTPGRGSNVGLQLSLPMHESTHHRPKQPLRLEGQRVLLVDDHIITLQLASRTLEEAGARLCSCSTGNQALASVEAFSPTLALLDMLLPDMHGTLLASKLRERFPQLRIYALSAMERTPGSPIPPQLQGWLPKPLDANELASALQSTPPVLPSTPAPLEPPKLDSLRQHFANGGQQALVEILQLAKIQLMAEAQVLKQTNAPNLREEWRHAAHHLKTTFLQLQMPLAAEQARQLEQSCDTVGTEQLTRMAQPLAEIAVLACQSLDLEAI